MVAVFLAAHEEAHGEQRRGELDEQFFDCGMAGDLPDALVEAEIELSDAERVLFALQLFFKGVEFFALGVVDAFRSEAHGAAFEEDAGFDDFVDLFGAQFDDASAAIGVGFEQAFVDELLHGFAKNGAGDAEFLGEGDLLDALSAMEATGENRVA